VYVTVALVAGYALGIFFAKGWKDYALCLPLSFLQYFATRGLMAWLFQNHGANPDLGLSIAAAAVQTPVLMLGVYLAHRKAKRAGYEV